MKKKNATKKHYLFKTFSLVLLVLIMSSCKKNDIPESNHPTEIPKNSTGISNENLIKFISATLQVNESEIKYNAEDNQFLVKGELKLDKKLIESHYNENNFK